jgi:hypothetical protein
MFLVTTKTTFNDIEPTPDLLPTFFDSSSTIF